MTFNPSTDVALFVTLPPGHPESLTTRAQDIANIKASGVTRLQLVASWTTVELLRTLKAETQVRRFALRLNESEWDTGGARTATRAHLAPLVAEGADLLFLGTEPDGPFVPQFGSPDWGERRAEQIRDAIYGALAAFKPLGVKVGSPALTYRGKYRDWREGLAPGWFRWWEILRNAANACDLNCVHIYSTDGSSYDILERVRVGMWLLQSLTNKPVWIDEVGCDKGTDDVQMGALVRFFTLLTQMDPAHPQWGQWAHSGERVVGGTVWCLNGNGKGWPQGQIISDLAAYQTLGQLIGGKRFYY